MRDLITRCSAAAAALLLSLAVEAQAAGPGATVAAARGTCSFGVLCGWIYNHDDHIKLMVTSDWGRYKDRRTWRIVKPNSTGRDAGVQDVDGFYVGPGCKVKIAGVRWMGPGWHKIRDGQFVQVTDIRC